MPVWLLKKNVPDDKYQSSLQAYEPPKTIYLDLGLKML
jgi:hypothetical protein